MIVAADRAASGRYQRKLETLLFDAREFRRIASAIGDYPDLERILRVKFDSGSE